MENIVQKAISGNASSAEMNDLQVWLAASEENRKLYDEQLLLWQFVGSAKKKDVSSNVDVAWEKFTALQAEEQEKKSGFMLYRIAAVLIVMLVVGSIGYYLYQNETTLDPVLQAKEPVVHPRISDTATIQVASSDPVEAPFVRQHKQKNTDLTNNEFHEVILPDSSSVTLGKNSVLDFLNYTSEKRVVNLAGAGFFNLKPLSQDFVIETKELIIRVEGTKFDIQTETEGNPFINLSVEEGRMVAYEVANPSNKVVITSRETYIYDINKHEFIEVKQVQEDTTRWKRFVNKISRTFKKKDKDNN